MDLIDSCPACNSKPTHQIWTETPSVLFVEQTPTQSIEHLRARLHGLRGSSWARDAQQVTLPSEYVLLSTKMEEPSRRKRICAMPHYSQRNCWLQHIDFSDANVGRSFAVVPCDCASTASMWIRSFSVAWSCTRWHMWVRSRDAWCVHPLEWFVAPLNIPTVPTSCRSGIVWRVCKEVHVRNDAERWNHHVTVKSSTSWHAVGLVLPSTVLRHCLVCHNLMH